MTQSYAHIHANKSARKSKHAPILWMKSARSQARVESLVSAVDVELLFSCG